ncbi:MAG TPA: hypothetical protein VLE73_02150 [Candidatus Saccharimonadales bacterium]|nr:hypothetical protein [Candidatus Saccharimonadales bacterium]
MMRSHFERSAIALTATTVCSLGAVTAEQQDVPVPGSVVASSAPAPVALGAYKRIDVKIYPVTVDAKGFGPAVYPPHMLEQDVRDGWSTIVRAAGGVTSTKVSVETEPVQTVKLPGDVTKQPELCNNEIRKKFVNTLIDKVVPEHPKGNPEEPSVPIVVIQDIAKSRCVDGVTNHEGIVIANGTAVAPGAYPHELGHKLFNFGHDDYLVCSNYRRPVVGKNCALYEYGDPQTIMGGAKASNSDPLNAHELLRIGAILEENVTTVYSDEPQELTLQSLNSKTAGIKAVRIPITGIDELPAAPNSRRLFTNTAPQLTCATAIMLELSSDNKYSHDSLSFALQPLSIKAYLVNESDKAKGKDAFRIASELDGDTLVITAGHKTVHVRVRGQESDLLQSLAAVGHADLTVQTSTGSSRRADSCNH